MQIKYKIHNQYLWKQTHVEPDNFVPAMAISFQILSVTVSTVAAVELDKSLD